MAPGAIRAANKRRMLARLEVLRTGARATQAPLLRFPEKKARHVPVPKGRQTSAPPKAHCFHLRDRLNPPSCERP
jgi:hypothetical protein